MIYTLQLFSNQESTRTLSYPLSMHMLAMELTKPRVVVVVVVMVVLDVVLPALHGDGGSRITAVRSIVLGRWVETWQQKHDSVNHGWMVDDSWFGIPFF